MQKNSEQNRTIFSGVMLGYLVLLLHILLMIILGVTVVVIKGVYDFRWLILGLGLLLLGGSAYYFYRRFQADKQRIKDLMNDPSLQNRSFEISLMGGLASVKLGHRNDDIQLIENRGTAIKQLGAPQSAEVAELTKLTQMLSDGLITREEFEKLKQSMLHESPH
jgi:hypothetical protein